MGMTAAKPKQYPMPAYRLQLNGRDVGALVRMNVGQRQGWELTIHRVYWQAGGPTTSPQGHSARWCKELNNAMDHAHNALLVLQGRGHEVKQETAAADAAT
jgi:hypothetical protein